MKPEEPIYYGESNKLKNLFSNLIDRHNVLCAIEKKFIENSTAYLYFESARQEVLDSGNASLDSMFTIAIDSMANQLQDFLNDEDDTEMDKLRNKIYALESENRKLKTKLDNISKAVNGDG